jgi:hypothetical protein
MSLSRLATVELQLVMQHFDLRSLVALARCNHFTFASASEPTAWRFVPAMAVSLPFASPEHRAHWADAWLPQHRRSLLRLTSQAVMIGRDNGSSSSTAEELQRDLALLPCVVAMTANRQQEDSGPGTGSSSLMELFAGSGIGNRADGGDDGGFVLDRLIHLDVGSTTVPDAPAFVKCIAVHAPHLRKLSFCCPRDARMAPLADALSCMSELQVVQLFFFPLLIAACAFAPPTPTLSSSSVSVTAGANNDESGEDAAPPRLQRMCLNNPCQLELLAYPLARNLRCLHLSLAVSLGAIDHLHGFDWTRILACATQLRCLEFDRCANPLLESMLGAIVSESNSSRLLPRLRHLSIHFHLAGSGYFDHTWNPSALLGLLRVLLVQRGASFCLSLRLAPAARFRSMCILAARMGTERANLALRLHTEVERAMYDFVAADSHNNKQITLSSS